MAVEREEATAIATPEWLARHGGSVEPFAAGKAWFLVFDGEPHYRLVPVPAGGKYACQVMQTENGKRLDKGGVFPTLADAVRGGLEDLRQALGW